MIYYDIGWTNIFKLKGSVIPKGTRAALPCSLIAALIRWMVNAGYLGFLEAEDSVMNQSQAWAGFSVLVGFLVIFRTSQAYSRFWEGCGAAHRMAADFFDASSALISFTEMSKAPPEKISAFKHTVVRLMSMIHSAAFMDLQEHHTRGQGHGEVVATPMPVQDCSASGFHLIDPMGIDAESLKTLHETRDKVTLLFHWMQLLIVRNIESGILNVPPPILSRAHQELANGMVAFHDCQKIADTPFPFPYSQNVDLLLCIHWILQPFVMSQWVSSPLWAFFFVYLQVFSLWSLNYIAVEIENPFGTDDNDIDGRMAQQEMNERLLLLVEPKTQRTPILSDSAIFSPQAEHLPWMERSRSFHDTFVTLEKDQKMKPCLEEMSDQSGLGATSEGDASCRDVRVEEQQPLPAHRDGARLPPAASGGGQKALDPCPPPTGSAPLGPAGGRWEPLPAQGGGLNGEAARPDAAPKTCGVGRSPGNWSRGSSVAGECEMMRQWQPQGVQAQVVGNPGGFAEAAAAPVQGGPRNDAEAIRAEDVTLLPTEEAGSSQAQQAVAFSDIDVARAGLRTPSRNVDARYRLATCCSLSCTAVAPGLPPGSRSKSGR